ncbi:MAG: Murein DD-endopeptidase MepM and murein hydrolase activator NlpD, containing LysM domain [Marmoricola sp.]|nr:Murein DD-endopeptidase MepM and murein hydrolase activator NlpD, containing LysM domain [Marmoricola sp.]
MLSAHADDLKDKKNQVHQGVRKASGDLEESSASAAAATQLLANAQARLGTAQRKLASTQGQLAAATVIDRRMQARLVTAQAALVTAVQELADGVADVQEQRADIGRLAASNYENGDPRLLGLSMVLNSQNPEDLSTQLNAIDDLMAHGTTLLATLKDTEARLERQKDKVAQAKAAVADQRQEAAVNLAHKRTLQQQAASNRAKVASLVSARSAAASKARTARAADLRTLKKLKKEESRIEKLILARAKKHKGKGFSGTSDGFLYPPVPGYVTSPYGYRVHPIYGYYSLHDGDDFHAPCGTPERAGAAGTVISEYYSDVWGNRLFLDVGKVNGKQMTLIYNHISSYKARTGEKVGRGDVLAYAGTTGWSTGCHLHFTVMLDGKAVDPQNYL